MQYIIVGLGNPGAEYEKTRHNTGRIALEYFRGVKKFPEWEYDKKLRALVSAETIRGERTILMLPETFMNKSGASVKPFVKNMKQAERLIVAHDDLDIPIGSFKISFNRGAAGHKGVESIARAIKTKAFIRLRLGISPATPGGKLKKPRGEQAVGKFILGIFKPKELELLKHTAKRATEALEIILMEGREKAMNMFN